MAFVISATGDLPDQHSLSREAPWSAWPSHVSGRPGGLCGAVLGGPGRDFSGGRICSESSNDSSDSLSPSLESRGGHVSGTTVVIHSEALWDTFAFRPHKVLIV